MCVMASNGNLVRSLICSMVSIVLITWAANTFAPEATMMLKALGVPVEGMITEGGHFGFNLPVVIISAISRIFRIIKFFYRLIVLSLLCEVYING